MALYLAHAIEIRDTVTIVSVPAAFVPNVLIAATLRRRDRDTLDRIGSSRRNSADSPGRGK